MVTKMALDSKDQNKHIQQVTQQNAALLILVQEQQKKIGKIMMQRKIIMNAMTKEKTATGALGNTMNNRTQNIGARTAKDGSIIAITRASHWRLTKTSALSGISKIWKTKANRKGQIKNDG